MACTSHKRCTKSNERNIDFDRHYRIHLLSTFVHFSSFISLGWPVCGHSFCCFRSSLYPYFCKRVPHKSICNTTCGDFKWMSMYTIQRVCVCMWMWHQKKNMLAPTMYYYCTTMYYNWCACDQELGTKYTTDRNRCDLKHHWIKYCYQSAEFWIDLCCA